MRRVLGWWLLGLTGGWLLSCFRAQAGADLFTWPMADVGSAALTRVLAIAVLGIALWKTRFGVRLSTLFALAIGYAAQGLSSGPFPAPGFVALVLIALLLLIGRSMARDKRTQAAQAASVDETGAQPANLGEMLGLAVAGGSLAIALESVARHVRLFGAGLAQDDTVFGATLLLLVALGAASFGWLAARPWSRRLSFPLLLGASATACFVSLIEIDGIADLRGFDRFVRRWNLDASYHGTIAVDALVAALCFVLPAFALGAGLVGARGKRSVGSAVLGAALGLALFPRFLRHDPQATTSTAELFCAQFVTLASLAALGGAAFAILCESRRKPRARWITLALCGALAVPSLTIAVKPIFVLSPWQGLVLPFLAFESPAGLATVEPSRGGLKMATIDRRAVTPPTEGTDADLQRIQLAFALVPKERRARGLRVLLVGQMSAVRGDAMLRAGAQLIDRTAPWHAAMARLEGELFTAQDKKTGIAPPPGEILAPEEARKRFEHGDYDLVIAPPVPGDPPRVEALQAPENTVVVRWFSCDEPLRGFEVPETVHGAGENTVLSREVVLSANGLEDLCLGVITHATLPAPPDPTRPHLEALMPVTVPSPLAWLTTRKTFRIDAARLAVARSFPPLTGASVTPLVLGMRAYYAAQVPSSPYETAEQKIELPDEALQEFSKLGQHGLDAFEKQLWEWLAHILSGKREVERIDKYVAPLAASFAPWPALEIALARADLEALEPRKAIERLKMVEALGEKSFELWAVLGDANAAGGDGVGAKASWRRALELRPTDRGVRRKLAVMLARAGDAEGKDMIRELLLEDPHDEELRTLAERPPTGDFDENKEH